VRPLAVLLAAGLLLTACGEAPRPVAEVRVKLKLDLPSEGASIRDDQVEVRGTVTPADATVQVAGEDAQVDGGQFIAAVPLDPGDNVIDVTASSPGRRPAAEAVRVERDMRVQVPSVAGQTFDEASAALKKVGLKATEQRGGSWLDRVLGSEFHVCTATPVAGSLVNPNTSVTLATAPDC